MYSTQPFFGFCVVVLLCFALFISISGIRICSLVAFIVTQETDSLFVFACISLPSMLILPFLTLKILYLFSFCFSPSFSYSVFSSIFYIYSPTFDAYLSIPHCKNLVPVFIVLFSSSSLSLIPCFPPFLPLSIYFSLFFTHSSFSVSFRFPYPSPISQYLRTASKRVGR